MESNYCIYLLEAAVLTVICGWVGIPLLKKLKARQSIRTEGPKSHRAKSGTPTMGGLFMLTAMVLVVLFNRLLDPSVLWLLFLTLGHGLLGFLDDFIKAEKKRNLGLTAKQNDLMAEEDRLNIEWRHLLLEQGTLAELKRSVLALEDAESARSQLRVQESLTVSQEMDLVPAWVEVDAKKFSGVFKALPERSDLPSDINESLIIELYSK